MAEVKNMNENDNDNIDSLFDKRKSVRLTPENAKFSLSTGGLISLEVHTEQYGDEFFERVLPVRAFPITEPDEFISVREPDTREKGRGAEIGMIRKMSDFDERTQELLLSELDRRYFIPVIKKINKVQEKFGYLYFDVETVAGKVSFVMNNPYSNFRTFEDGRMFLYDIDGNCFEITDPNKLDKASLKRIEIYL